MLLPAMNELREIIRREIEACGVIPFARFMELSLYCPEIGYYERLTNTPGRRGDFFTSVSVGSLFGELLAFRFASWVEQAGFPEFQLLEAGAHDGRLAADVLAWFKARRPDLLGKLEYLILEPSPRRQQWQKKNLKRFGAQVQWFSSWDTLPRPDVQGIIFSNELLDALPIHRVGWDAKAGQWFEWGVAAENDGFVWKRLPTNSTADEPPFLSTPREEGVTLAADHPAHEPPPHPPFRLRQAYGGQIGHPLPFRGGEGRGEGAARRFRDAMRAQSSQNSLLIGRGKKRGQRCSAFGIPHLEDLQIALPDGFTTEVTPAAAGWWREAASFLKRGRLLTFDYGLAAEEFFLPHRGNGTLRAYYRHRPSNDLLANIGEQDLTADVNFTALQRAGEWAGLKTDGLFSQAEFLTRIGETIWRARSGFGEWSSNQTRQFQTLTHPEHLGRSFKVLVQSR